MPTQSHDEASKSGNVELKPCPSRGHISQRRKQLHVAFVDHRLRPMMRLLGLVLRGAIKSQASKHETSSGYLAKITCAAVEELIQVECFFPKVHVELESAERRLFSNRYTDVEGSRSRPAQSSYGVIRNFCHPRNSTEHHGS